ncbi:MULTISPECIES: hypothetical protein, partial [unclassified Neisseria]|uniref:hypothetical protein n=1 Tax=unclassified Neisseria TaxID=2623750 RepID=UPI0010727D4F
MDELRKNFYFFCRGILHLLGSLPSWGKSFLIRVRYVVSLMSRLVLAFVLPAFFLKSLKKEMEMIEKAAGESLAGFAAILFCLFSFSFQSAAAVFAFSNQAWHHVADCEWRAIGACLIAGHYVVFFMCWSIKKVITIGK